jgi:uncharacterized RDD family membrane protein YckC
LRRPPIVSCEKCSAQLPEGASFCAPCGHPVSVAQLGPVYVPPSVLPPQEILAQPAQGAAPTRQVYAGFWLRAVAFLIDTIILSFTFAMASSLSPSPLIIFPDPNAQLWMAIPQLTVAGFLFLFLMMWMYYAAFEASAWQATPGKRVMKLYVTDLSGHPVTFGRASMRYFGRKISELTFLVGYILAGFTERKQALHDLIAGCLVLRRPGAETFLRTPS